MSEAAADLAQDIETLGEKLGAAKASITNRFIGQERVVELTLTALLCGGHGLLIGLPGLGKTRLVETLSTVMGMNGNRVQFTPDLMPADILGSEVLDTAADGTRSFRFVEGPIFCQLLMADEINRASPRTQSALLQAMQEKTVTVAGQDRALGTPFHVLATQNPIEQEGTYPLPEAQLDRFLVQIDVLYPTRETERDILLATTGVEDAQSTQVFTSEELLAAQNGAAADAGGRKRGGVDPGSGAGLPSGRGRGKREGERDGQLGAGAARGAGPDAGSAGQGAAGRAFCAIGRRRAEHGAACSEPPDGPELCRKSAGRQPFGPD